jgi:hypothetical protein
MTVLCVQPVAVNNIDHRDLQRIQLSTNPLQDPNERRSLGSGQKLVIGTSILSNASSKMAADSMLEVYPLGTCVRYLIGVKKTYLCQDL